MPKILTFDPEGVSMTATTQAPVMGVNGSVFVPFSVAAGSVTFNGQTEIDIDEFATPNDLDEGIKSQIEGWCTKMAPYVLLMQALSMLGY